MTSGQVRLVGICVLTLFIDQITKHFASRAIVNTGISFGLFSSGITTIALMVVLVLIAVSYGKVFFRMSPTASGIFFGASSSNLLDRVLFGGVRDFLPLPILGVQNNLADWGIILSLLWIVWGSRQVGQVRQVDK